MRITQSTAVRGLAVVSAGAALFASAMLGTTQAANASVDHPATSAHLYPASDQTPASQDHPKPNGTPEADSNGAEADSNAAEADSSASEHGSGAWKHDPKTSEDETTAPEDEATAPEDEATAPETEGSEAEGAQGEQPEKDGKKDGKDHSKDGKKDGKDHSKDGKKDGEKHHGRKHHKCYSESETDAAAGDNGADAASGTDEGSSREGSHSWGCAMPQGSVDSGRGGAVMAAEQSPVAPISLGALSALMLGTGAWMLVRARRVAGRSVK